MGVAVPRRCWRRAGQGWKATGDALPSSSSLRAANQSRLLLLTGMDLAQHMSQVWGDWRGTLSFPTGIK